MTLINTKIWKLSKSTVDNEHTIKEIAQQFNEGKVIAIPTETVYGLGANVLNDEAIDKIFLAKGRPNDNPLIVHIAKVEQLDLLVSEINDISKKLIEHFWPGPLTLIFKKKENISDKITAGLPTVAVRMPNHPIALEIINAANIPIAAPSANRSGKPSPTTAEHVWNDLNGFIDGIVDGGKSGIGLESTVVDVTGNIPIVLRPGGITIEELERVIGKVEVDKSLTKDNELPRSPGMKYKHYAPEGEMLIVQGKKKVVANTINKLTIEKKSENKKVGVLTSEENIDLYRNADLVLGYGTKENLYPLAEYLYDALRSFDINSINYILVEGVEEHGIGLTIMNRLKKAANGNILSVEEAFPWK